ncbi:MAG: hypothetical protein NXI20_23065 [bacterium]|nr:hypothetical protein [bacterium]
MKKSHAASSFLPIIIVFSISCSSDDGSNPDGDDGNGSSELVAASITVYDANSWVSASEELDLVDGATINLYNDEDSYNSGAIDYTATTDASGTGTVMIPEPQDLDGDGFSDVNRAEFIITISKDGKTNFTSGYAIAGVFFCQSELDDYNNAIQDGEYQPGAEVGHIRHTDLNGDGVINAADLTDIAYITLSVDSEDNDDPSVNDPTLISCSNKPTEKNVGYIGN